MASTLPYNMGGTLQIKNKIMMSLIHKMFSKFSKTFDKINCKELSW